jgi:hypothetical protein
VLRTTNSCACAHEPAALRDAVVGCRKKIEQKKCARKQRQPRIENCWSSAQKVDLDPSYAPQGVNSGTPVPTILKGILMMI